VFGDVNLQEAPTTRGPPYNPGAGGWPTIRYFTRETGLDGAPYAKKTDKSMCDELGDVDTLIDYVEQAAKTALCGTDGANCSEKELAYLNKVKEQGVDEQRKQLERLEGMVSTAAMKDELADWNRRRRRILKRLISEADVETAEEL